MPEWTLSKDMGTWEYRDGAKVLGTLRWNGSTVAGTYVDGDGNPLSKKFEEARRMVEARANGKEPTPAKGQQRLAL